MAAIAHPTPLEPPDLTEPRSPAAEPRLRDTWILGWRQAGLFVVAFVLMTAVFASVGWLLFGDDRRSALVRLDERAIRWFADHRSPGWNTASHAGSLLAETAVKVIVTAVIVLVMLRVFRRWFEAMFVAMSLILEAAVFITTTALVGRTRPDVPRLDGSPLGSAYPSGHVAAAVCYSAAALVVIWNTRRRWLRVLCAGAAVAVPLIVAASRMYRGMHFPSDVVAGMILGAVSVVVTWLILAPAERARRARLTADDHPMRPAATDASVAHVSAE